ncbi:trypsin-like isoform X4 [Daphnia pulicaria]|uniref:trypsin-like isoform X4 n=1 Tax=Daphnia pulicaria TaxID=35523 RepID=UPI001EEC06F9|nr:trypsin-like isoform X4 [Daphnia pulicaria]
MRFILLAMGLFSLVGIVVSSEKAGGNVPSISIYGGTEAARGEFPYMVFLDLNGPFCGGSLIGPSHVLTAEHCLSANQSYASTYTAIVNTLAWDGSTPGAITRKVKKIIRHPTSDIGLLVLRSAVTNVKPIPLPSPLPPTTTKKPGTTKAPTKKTTGRPITTKAPACSCTCPTTTTKRAVAVTTKKPVAVLRGFRNYANVSAIIAGWGTTSFGGSISSTLLKANVTILDNSDPKCAVYGSSFIGANMLCAAAPGKDTCQGDSGGPIFVNGVVVGITSFGNGCADPRFAGVYARVSAYVGWIQTTQANNP